MKLRLKTASTGAAFKLEIPAGGTWGVLQSECRAAVGLPADAELQLSLNKKVPLGAEPHVTVTSLGLCSGDLLWLLSPEPQSSGATGANSVTTAANQGSTAASASRTAVNGRNTPAAAAPAAPAAAAAPATLSPTSAAQPSAAAAPATEGPPGSASRPQKRAAEAEDGRTGARGEPTGAATATGTGTGTGGSHSGDGAGGCAGPGESRAGAGGSGDAGGGGVAGPMDVDAVADEEGEAAEAAGEEAEGGTPADVLLGPPGVSLRLRCLLTPAPPTDGAVSDRAGGGGGSGAGNAAGAAAGAAPWARLPAAARALLLLDCALAEAGFVGMQDLPALALGTLSTPPAPLPRQLLYGCPYISGNDGAATTLAAVADAAAVAVRASDGGDVRMMEAVDSLAARPAADDATHDAETSGASAQRKGVRPVAKLLWYTMGQYLVVHGVPSGNGGGGGSGGAVTLHEDLTEYGDGGGGGGGGAPPGRVAAAGWRRLKDGLALPLLAAACRAAGLAAPLGLLVLPLELQLSVLSRLQAKDLASLSRVCTPLHALASEDCLWRPLYEAEFGGGAGGAAAPPGDVAYANTNGYKALFARRWRQRAEMRRRRQMFRPVVPPPPRWGPPHAPPFARPPFMPPGAIGGDYDRLPAPLLGGGPGGMFGGGMFGGARGGLFSGGGLPGLPGLPGMPGMPGMPGLPGLPPHRHPGGLGPGLGPGRGPRPGRPWGGGGGGGGGFGGGGGGGFM